MKKRVLTIISLVLIIVFGTLIFSACDGILSSSGGLFSNISNNKTDSSIPNTPEKALKKLEKMGFDVYNMEDDIDIGEDDSKNVYYYINERECDIEIEDYDMQDELYDLYGDDYIGEVYYFFNEATYADAIELFFYEYDFSIENGWEIVDGAYYYYLDKDKEVGYIVIKYDEYKMLFYGLISLWEEFSK